MADPQSSSAPSPSKPAIILRGPVVADDGEPGRISFLIPRPDTFEEAAAAALRLFPYLGTILADQPPTATPGVFPGKVSLAVTLSGLKEVHVTPEAWDAAPLAGLPLDKPLVLDVDVWRLPWLQQSDSAETDETDAEEISEAELGETEAEDDEAKLFETEENEPVQRLARDVVAETRQAETDYDAGTGGVDDPFAIEAEAATCLGEEDVPQDDEAADVVAGCVAGEADEDSDGGEDGASDSSSISSPPSPSPGAARPLSLPPSAVNPRSEGSSPSSSPQPSRPVEASPSSPATIPRQISATPPRSGLPLSPPPSFSAAQPATSSSPTPHNLPPSRSHRSSSSASQRPTAHPPRTPPPHLSSPPPLPPVSAQPVDDPVPPPQPGDCMRSFKITSYVPFDLHDNSKMVELCLPPNGHVYDLLAELEDRLGLDVATAFSKYTLRYGSRGLRWGEALSDITSNDPDAATSLALYKHGQEHETGIYFFPPQILESVHVEIICAAGSWISQHYPRVRVEPLPDRTRRMQWVLDAAADGRLYFPLNGCHHPYLLCDVSDQGIERPLFWMDPRPAELHYNSLPFSIFTGLTPENACSLPVDDFLSRLPSILELFPLTSDMRSTFLKRVQASVRPARPSQRDTLMVAFRFASQEDLDHAIHLRIRPRPDVVARVVLLFAHFDRTERREKWRNADEVDWVAVSGIDVARARDKSLFRVIEWGAMKAVL